MCISSVYIV